MKRLFAALDLTRLGDADTPEDIEALCLLAARCPVPPAALCVHPEMIVCARRGLADCGLDAVVVATVVNFPDGGADPDRIVREIHRSRGAGAQEIDAVLPWRRLLADDTKTVESCLAAARQASGALPLKIILETGELVSPKRIRQASELAVAAGADFIKTSTGKMAVNATPEAAEIMLQVIAEHGGQCGFKAAGGIRTPEQAAVYFALADRLLGSQWASPKRFRLGASSLAESALEH